jgi:hypothetical protein
MHDQRQAAEKPIVHKGPGCTGRREGGHVTQGRHLEGPDEIRRLRLKFPIGVQGRSEERTDSFIDEVRRPARGRLYFDTMPL